MIDGVLIVIDEIVLITPGVLTDLFCFGPAHSLQQNDFQALAQTPIRPHGCGGECPPSVLWAETKTILMIVEAALQ